MARVKYTDKKTGKSIIVSPSTPRPLKKGQKAFATIPTKRSQRFG